MKLDDERVAVIDDADDDAEEEEEEQEASDENDKTVNVDTLNLAIMIY